MIINNNNFICTYFYEENTSFLKLLEHSDDTHYKLFSSFIKIFKVFFCIMTGDKVFLMQNIYYYSIKQ